MKIIVCGAGSVGKSIVGYLSRGNNDIIVIDTDSKKLDEISKEWDIQPILGSASHPDILDKAGAQNADIIIAATNYDEVNLVTCQVAQSLFNVPKKIARIDSASFLDPRWNTLYSEKNIPVDSIISPEIEIAKAILEIVKFPGTSEVLTLADKKIYLLAFRAQNTCPLIQTPLVHLNRLAPELDISIVSIVRNGKNFIPNGNDMIHAGDEIYLLVDADKIDSTIHDFGMEHTPVEKIIIFGGNLIVRYLASKLEQDDNITSCKIIDEDDYTADLLARDLDNTVVIHGEMMSDVILEEAAIEKTDATIAVTTKDKDNLLASLLAKKSGVPYAISLVNSRSYDSLVDNIVNNILVDRSSVTISGILQELRKAKISNAYSLGRGFGEIWEIKIDENNYNAGKTISDIGLPKNSSIGAVYRNNEVLFPSSSDKLETGDLVILFVSTQDIRKVEKIFN